MPRAVSYPAVMVQAAALLGIGRSNAYHVVRTET
jgi:hypothetical protein